MSKELATAYLTAYALTRGIIKMEGEIMKINGNEYFTAKKVFAGRDKFCMTKEAALFRAEEMRQKKIQSLKKQLAKMENLTFKIEK